MQQLASDLYLLDSLLGANVYVILRGASSPPGLTLVDSGLRRDGKAISSQLQAAGFSLSQVKEIVLTHAHADHAGGAAALAARTGAGITAHPAAVPYLTGKQILPYPSLTQRIIFWITSRLALHPPAGAVIRKVGAGDDVQAGGGLDVIHTPGHTPGSTSYYQAERGILFCGDALFTRHPLTGRPGLQLPPRLVTVAPELAYQSALQLAELDLNLLCPGHGAPLEENPGSALDALLKEKP